MPPETWQSSATVTSVSRGFSCWWYNFHLIYSNSSLIWKTDGEQSSLCFWSGDLHVDLPFLMTVSKVWCRQSSRNNPISLPFPLFQFMHYFKHSLQQVSSWLNYCTVALTLPLTQNRKDRWKLYNQSGINQLPLCFWKRNVEMQIIICCPTSIEPVLLGLGCKGLFGWEGQITPWKQSFVKNRRTL